MDRSGVKEFLRRRGWSVAAIFGAVLVTALTGLVCAWDRARSDVVAAGVTVGGVPVGGLEAEKARRRLDRELVPKLKRPVRVEASGRVARLDTSDVRLSVNVEQAVEQAVARSREGGIPGRALRAVTGGRVNVDIVPTVEYSRRSIRAWVKRLGARFDRKPRSAGIRFDGVHIRKVDGRKGRAVKVAALVRKVSSELGSIDGDRRIKATIMPVQPKIWNRRDLAKRYPAVVTVNRRAFRAVFWKKLRPVKTYTIAVGQAGFDSPAGRRSIVDKAVNPTWHVPNKAWAGSLAGQVIPGGDPRNPLIARWMGVTWDGVGFHGTNEIGSLGSAASHGCFRMAPSDAIDLYDRVSVGTPVFID